MAAASSSSLTQDCITPSCIALQCSSSSSISSRCKGRPSHFRLQSQFVPGASCSIGSYKHPVRQKTCRFTVSAAIKETRGSITDADGLRFAVVVGRFNEFVTRPLLAGALETFKTHAVKDDNIEVVWVPGSFEIPVVAQALAKTGKYNAVLCIGTVIRGDTTHYEAVANSAASGVLSASLNSGVPCIFGVLTCETLEQALQRAGGKAGNKGAEAAVTAIEMASLFKQHLHK